VGLKKQHKTHSKT